jgi:hypothetical protein
MIGADGSNVLQYNRIVYCVHAAPSERLRTCGEYLACVE